MQNKILNSIFLYHKTNFNLTLLFLKYIIRNIKMLLNPNPELILNDLRQYHMFSFGFTRSSTLVGRRRVSLNGSPTDKEMAPQKKNFQNSK